MKFNKKQSGEFTKSKKKFGDVKRFTDSKIKKNKGKKGQDKTNSQNRDHRPIGGKFGKNKFKRKFN